jgi:hypothetical protein
MNKATCRRLNLGLHEAGARLCSARRTANRPRLIEAQSERLPMLPAAAP